MHDIAQQEKVQETGIRENRDAHLAKRENQYSQTIYQKISIHSTSDYCEEPLEWG